MTSGSLSSSAHDAAPRVLGLPEHWFFLLVGAVTAPVFALTPLLSFMGWFVGSIAHELGHTLVAWFFGIPSFPAIRLDGHAATVHEEPVFFFAVVLWIALVGGATRVGTGRVRIAAVAVALVGYPLLTWTSAQPLLVLAGGHLTELAIGAVFLWRAMTGGFTASVAERGLYGTIGWLLVGTNVVLTARLVVSDQARDLYRGSGSFGLTNDYIRIANGFAEGSVPFVAGVMTLVGIGVVVATVLAARPFVGR